MFNPIHIGLSPNLRLGDSLLALKLLFQPWRWKIGRQTQELENWFKKYLGAKEVMAFNSGRSAEHVLLKALGVGKGDEVLIQAFTCVAVPNSILWTGAKPVYVDIDGSLNMDPADLERKITFQSRAIIVQHTFGIPAKMAEILRVAKKHHLFVIEDCAHVINLGKLEGARPLQFSDGAFYSFGRDKAVSSVFGGMAVTNEKLKIKNKKLRWPSYFWIFQQLLHPVVSFFILPLYNFFGTGKMILFILQKLYLLSFPVYQEEKIGKRPTIFPAKMPNALAILALNQLKNLEEFNKKRIEIAKIYQKKLKILARKKSLKLVDDHQTDIIPWLRYPILTDQADELRKFAKRRGIILGDWYSHVIDPKDVDLKKTGYQPGSCPVAEKIAFQVVNLPTYPRMGINDVYKVIKVIYEFFGKKYNTTKY